MFEETIYTLNFRLEAFIYNTLKFLESKIKIQKFLSFFSSKIKNVFKLAFVYPNQIIYLQVCEFKIFFA